ncbi:MAG: KTSC domain-containing protein [Microbacteriaceae bacterium]|nr:KTSC domain-containing protein [Microbacteriaceae bacterium]
MAIQPPDPDAMMSSLSPNSLSKPLSQKQVDLLYSDQHLALSYGLDEPAATNPNQTIYEQAQSPAGIGIFAGMPIAASKGEFYEAVRVFASESHNYMHPDDASMYPASAPSVGYNYNNNALNAVSPSAPASLTDIPTSTTDPSRPRTIAAGYDSSRRTLTVVFRDGTYYNYYEVSALEWSNFKRARSKGRFIATYLDIKSRGAADVTTLSQQGREALYRVSRTGQILRKGYTGKQVAGSKRGIVRTVRGVPQYPYKTGNLGGTGRKRAKGKP